MDGADILGIVALALGGGAGAYAIWYVVRFGTGDLSASPNAAGEPTATAPGRLRVRQAATDPALLAEIAALRTEIAAIAATQARMLHGQADHEGMLLGEMRAIASAMDPKIVESLARIENTVGTAGTAASAPKPEDAPEETLVGGPDDRPAGGHESGSGEDLATDAGGNPGTGRDDASAAGGNVSAELDHSAEGDGPEADAEDRRADGPAGGREGERLYVLPYAREDNPEKPGNPARTIRRG